MNGRVVGVPTNGGELDIKRFYIPGVVVESECPECGLATEVDLGDEYLSHPEIGQPEAVYFICEGEGTHDEDESHYVEWQEDVIVAITVTLAGDEQEITEAQKELARKLAGDPLDPPDDPRDQFLYGAYAESRRVHHRIDDGETGPNFIAEIKATKVAVKVDSQAPSGTKIAQAIEEKWKAEETDFSASQLWEAVEAVKALLS